MQRGATIGRRLDEEGEEEDRWLSACCIPLLAWTGRLERVSHQRFPTSSDGPLQRPLLRRPGRSGGPILRDKHPTLGGRRPSRSQLSQPTPSGAHRGSGAGQPAVLLLGGDSRAQLHHDDGRQPRLPAVLRPQGFWTGVLHGQPRARAGAHRALRRGRLAALPPQAAARHHLHGRAPDPPRPHAARPRHRPHREGVRAVGAGEPSRRKAHRGGAYRPLQGLPAELPEGRVRRSGGARRRRRRRRHLLDLLRGLAEVEVGGGGAAGGGDEGGALRVAEAGGVQLGAGAGGGEQRVPGGGGAGGAPVARGPREEPPRQVGAAVDAQHRQLVHGVERGPRGVGAGARRAGGAAQRDQVQLRLLPRRLRPLQALRQVHHLGLQGHHLDGPPGHARQGAAAGAHLGAAQLLHVAEGGAEVLHLEGAGGVAALQLAHVEARRLQLRRHAQHRAVALAVLPAHLLQQHLQVHLAPLQLEHAVAQVPRLALRRALLRRARLQRLPQPLVLLLQPGDQAGLRVAAAVLRRVVLPAGAAVGGARLLGARRVPPLAALRRRLRLRGRRGRRRRLDAGGHRPPLRLRLRHALRRLRPRPAPLLAPDRLHLGALRLGHLPVRLRLALSAGAGVGLLVAAAAARAGHDVQQHADAAHGARGGRGAALEGAQGGGRGGQRVAPARGHPHRHALRRRLRLGVRQPQPLLPADAPRLRDEQRVVPAFGVDDLHLHQTGAQTEELQVVSNYCGKVLVVVAVAIPIQVGRVLVALLIPQRVTAKFLWDPVTPAPQSHHLGAPCVSTQNLQDISLVPLGEIQRSQHLQERGSNGRARLRRIGTTAVVCFLVVMFPPEMGFVQELVVSRTSTASKRCGLVCRRLLSRGHPSGRVGLAPLRASRGVQVKGAESRPGPLGDPHRQLGRAVVTTLIHFIAVHFFVIFVGIPGSIRFVVTTRVARLLALLLTM
mmetsp:Transcript_16448/g.35761  ORF Transcript_16448/g.35761 Transcript_16448/m.35761 type:complete len:948 (-) Transcript_16448:495-3338(-)